MADDNEINQDNVASTLRSDDSNMSLEDNSLILSKEDFSREFIFKNPIIYFCYILGLVLAVMGFLFSVGSIINLCYDLFKIYFEPELSKTLPELLKAQELLTSQDLSKSHKLSEFPELLKVRDLLGTQLQELLKAQESLTSKAQECEKIKKSWYVVFLMAMDKILISMTICVAAGKILLASKRNIGYLRIEKEFDFHLDIDEQLGSMILITAAFCFLGIVLNHNVDGIKVFSSGIGIGCFIATLGYWISNRKLTTKQHGIPIRSSTDVEKNI